MVAIIHVSSFTWTVGMHNLTLHDAKCKSKTVGSIFLPEAMVTFWSQVEVPLITVCFYIFKVLVLQICLRLPQVCENRMMIGISHSFSRTFDMLVHFHPHKRRHPFQWFSPAVAWIFWGWSFRGAFGRQHRKPSLPFCINFTWIRIDYYFISTRLDIFLNSMIKTNIINVRFSQPHV